MAFGLGQQFADEGRFIALKPVTLEVRLKPNFTNLQPGLHATLLRTGTLPVAPQELGSERSFRARASCYCGAKGMRGPRGFGDVGSTTY